MPQSSSRERYQDARFRRRLGRQVNALEQLTVDVAAGRLNIIEGQRVSPGLAAGGELGVHDLRPWFGTSVWMTGLDSWERGLLLGRVLHSGPARHL